jgi:hypothetical protein
MLQQGSVRDFRGDTLHLTAEPDRCAPADDAREQSVRPLMSWPRVPGATIYRLQIGYDSTFSALVVDDSLVTDTTRRCVEPLRNETPCYWRVGWIDSAGIPEFSRGFRFWTASPPTFSPRSCVLAPTKRGGRATGDARLHNPTADSVLVDSVMVQARQFRVLNTFPALLLPHDSLTLVVEYTPDRFSITRDTIVAFTGQGMSLLPVIAESPDPVLHIPTRELHFGPIRTSDTSEAVVGVENVGPVNDLVVTRVLTRTPFFTPEKSTFMVGPDARKRLSLRFQVKAMRGDRFGVYNDTLLIESDGGKEKIVLRGESPPPRPVLSAHALDFGLVGIPDSASGTITIRNTSINDLVIDSIVSRHRIFKPSILRGRVVHPDSLQMQVRFRPARFGPCLDTLVMYNNSWSGPIRVACSGKVPYPAIEADFERVNFGKVEVGDSGIVTIRVRSRSLSVLKIDSIGVRARHFRIGNPVPRQLLWRGDEMTVRVAFYPDSARKFFDTLVVVNNSETARFKIPLLAEAISSRSGSRGARLDVYELYQNFPNPFSAQTTFSYNLPQRSRVRLEVFTTLGQHKALVLDTEQQAGIQNIPWESNLTSGVYYYRLYAVSAEDPSKQFAESRKMVVVR